VLVPNCFQLLREAGCLLAQEPCNACKVPCYFCVTNMLCSCAHLLDLVWIVDIALAPREAAAVDNSGHKQLWVMQGRANQAEQSGLKYCSYACSYLPCSNKQLHVNMR
jgi:hypothetical protein